MSGETIYECRFYLGSIEGEVQSRHLSDLQGGFWINKDYEFTKGSDCKYWIPPHKIEYITKTETI